MYIVIEGQDATGKDTQAAMLANYFRKKGKKVVHYAESGTGSKDPFVTKVADLAYGSPQDTKHRARALLFLVNRYHQWRKLAEPALEKGDVVIITRYWFSTLIYEGYGGGVNRPLIERLHQEVMPAPYFHPTKIIIFTLSDADRETRLLAQGKRKSEVFKSMNSDFQKKLNQSYLEVAKDFNVPTMDTAGTPEEVHQRLLKLFKL